MNLSRMGLNIEVIRAMIRMWRREFIQGGRDDGDAQGPQRTDLKPPYRAMTLSNSAGQRNPVPDAIPDADRWAVYRHLHRLGFNIIPAIGRLKRPAILFKEL